MAKVIGVSRNTGQVDPSTNFSGYRVSGVAKFAGYQILSLTEIVPIRNDSVPVDPRKLEKLLLVQRCPADAFTTLNGNGNSQERGRYRSATVLALVLRIRQFHKLAVELIHFPILFGGVESVHGRAIVSPE